MGKRQGTDKEKWPLEAPRARAILDSIGDGVFTVDLDWRASTFNCAAAQTP